MLIIRLSRVGKKGQPFFRLIINEKAKDTQGSYLEILGSYNPRSKELNLKEERIKHWLSKGAQASPTVHNLFVDKGLLSGPKRSATSVKKKEGEGQTAAAPKPAEAPKAPEAPKTDEAKPDETPVETKPAEAPSETPTPAEKPPEAAPQA